MWFKPYKKDHSVLSSQRWWNAACVQNNKSGDISCLCARPMTNVPLPALIIRTPANLHNGGIEGEMRDTAGIRSWVLFFFFCLLLRPLCVFLCHTKRGLRILMTGFHWNSAADCQAPSGPRPAACVRQSLSPWLPCMMLAEAKQTLFFFFLVVYLPQRRGRDCFRRDEGKKQGRQLRQKRVKEEGWDATCSAQPCLRIQKVKLWFISGLHSSPGLHYLWASVIFHMTAQTCQNSTPFKNRSPPVDEDKTHRLRDEKLSLTSHLPPDLHERYHRCSPKKQAQRGREVFFEEASHHHAKTRTWLRW